MISRPRRAVAALALAAALVAIALDATSLYREHGYEVEAAGARAQTLAVMLEEHARQTLRRVEFALAHAEEELPADAGRAQPDALRSRLEEKLPHDGLIRSFRVFAPDGNFIVGTGSPAPRLGSVAERDYFVAQREAAGRGMVLGVPVRSRVDGEWVLPVSWRLEAPDGRFAGVLVASVRPAHFARFYAAVDTGRDGFVTLFHRSGRIVARSPANDALLERSWSDSPMFREHLPAAPAKTVRQVVVADGIERIYSYRALAELPVVVSVGLSLSEILAPWRARAWREAIGLALALGLLGVAAAALVRQLGRREAAEKAVAEAKQRLEIALEGSGTSVWELDLPSGQVWLDARWPAIVGGPPGEARTSAAALMDLVPGEDRPAIDAAVRRVVKGEASHYAVEHRTRAASGEPRWVLSRGRVSQRDEAGRAVRLSGTNTDITERKRIEEELARLNAELRRHAEQSASGLAEMRLRFELFMRHLPVLASIRDREGRIVYANEAWRALSGIDPAAAAGRTFAELFGAQVGQLIGAHGDEVLASGAARHFQYRHVVNGASRARESWQFPIPDADGRPTFVGAITFDVTEREQALEAMAESDRMKSAFLASMSHELRTPLGAILGFSELLREAANLTEEQRADLREIQSSGATMLAMVNGIIDLARIEGGTLELRLERADCEALLRGALDARRAEAQAKGVALELECAAPVGELALDARRFSQVMAQLLGNAIKFTPANGRVTCRARRLERDGVEGLEVAVADTGPGIDRHDQEKLFRPFVQLDDALARRHGGTGLGLALARRLAELHGGALDVESEPSKGSTFYLWLPAAGNAKEMAHA